MRTTKNNKTASNPVKVRGNVYGNVIYVGSMSSTRNEGLERWSKKVGMF